MLFLTLPRRIIRPARRKEDALGTESGKSGYTSLLVRPFLFFEGERGRSLSIFFFFPAVRSTCELGSAHSDFSKAKQKSMVANTTGNGIFGDRRRDLS